jgi:Tfp pilus assembly protein PilV
MLLRTTKGLSLVELLIATSIVGMIMLGMVSIDYALRANERQQTRTALIALKTSTELADITNTASQATGDIATRCIQRASNMSANNNNYICIYRDATPTPTPADTSDDTWTCYTRRGTNLHKCTFAVNVQPTPNNCANGDPVIGTVTADVYDDGDAPVVPADLNPNNLDLYLQITLKNRYDPTFPNTNGAKYSATYAQDYLTNPKIKLTTRVSPQACGR